MGKKTLVPFPMLFSNSEIRVKLCSLYVFPSAACLQCFMREKQRERERERERELLSEALVA